MDADWLHSMQEAARKALRDAMGDRRDVLAQFDKGDGDDDGGGSGGGGGFNWNWSWEEWKGRAGQFGQVLMKWFSGVGQTFKAIFVFAFGVLTHRLMAP